MRAPVLQIIHRGIASFPIKQEELDSPARMAAYGVFSIIGRRAPRGHERHFAGKLSPQFTSKTLF